MPARHRSRQRALQVLFAWDVRRISVDDSIASFYDTLHSEDEHAATPAHDAFMESLVRGTADAVDALDSLIKSKSANWRLERMASVDRTILRLAAYELTEIKTPPAVAIDEALELARQFSGEESVPFINGILDAIRKDLPPEA